MNILGIETSCDETAAAVVQNGTTVLSNVIASQIDLHKETGGVVPEVAAREHILKIIPVIEKSLKEANLTWDEINAIAAVPGPGLISALITGTLTASTLALVKDKPLIPVHHILAHIYGNWLERDNSTEFPVLVLTVSGGHNDLVLMKDHGDFELLGATRDDAAGEAFDKVAKLLGLGYPGGPAIQKTAEKGNSDALDFPIAKLEKDSLDFSFSGLKTAVLYEIQKEYGREFTPSSLDPTFVANVAASFQKTVARTLVQKVIKAVQKYQPKEIHIAGGVSANSYLREHAESELEKFGLPLKYPKNIAYCTDNAAMVASCGYFMYQKNPEKYSKWENIQPNSNFNF
ncbi:tRNA (adenosine(37)-N6)-threonylcarbamoyltransferase complex transferase subunit TsaD [Patescibacteria group bacterium]